MFGHVANSCNDSVDPGVPRRKALNSNQHCGWLEKKVPSKFCGHKFGLDTPFPGYSYHFKFNTITPPIIKIHFEYSANYGILLEGPHGRDGISMAVPREFGRASPQRRSTELRLRLNSEGKSRVRTHLPRFVRWLNFASCWNSMSPTVFGGNLWKCHQPKWFVSVCFTELWNFTWVIQTWLIHQKWK